jgi:hypothetical protein
VRNLVRERLVDVRRCYARALRGHPGLRGSLRLELEVHPLGFVRGVRPREGTFADEPLVRCVQRSAETWRFAPLDRGPDASIDIHLSFDGER